MCSARARQTLTVSEHHIRALVQILTPGQEHEQQFTAKLEAILIGTDLGSNQTVSQESIFRSFHSLTFSVFYYFIYWAYYNTLL